MKPGYVKIAQNGQSIYMPNLMSIDYNIYKLINSSMSLNADISKLEDEDPKKQDLAIQSQDITIKAIDAMIDKYDEYREFSKEFSIIDHIRVITSIGKGVKMVEVKEMVGKTMLIEENDEKDIEASKEPEAFLS